MSLNLACFGTPIVLIVFNRPEQTRLIFQSIRKLKPKYLFIISDGVRDGFHNEEIKVNEVRKIFDEIDWECNINKNFSIPNLGLEKRVLTGLSWVFSLVDKAIILEDDCLPHESFFQFCDELLNRYRNDQRIGMISGDNYWPNKEISKESYAFSNYTLTWGWATWSDRWNSFDPELKHYDKSMKDKVLNNLFKKKIELSYWKEIFDKRYIEWDYCWLITNWSQSRLCIYPGKNLISNIGFGYMATHTTDDSHHLANYSLDEIEYPLIHPSFIAINHKTETEIRKILYSITTIKWLRSKIRRLYYIDLLIKRIKALLS